MFMLVDEFFYIKLDVGLLLGLLVNVDLVGLYDVQVEELDIVIVIDYIQNGMMLEIWCLVYVWVGLCFFVSDGSFVGGYDIQVLDFFWVVGQGGYGIQFLLVVGEVYVVLIWGELVLVYIVCFGVDVVVLSLVWLG